MQARWLGITGLAWSLASATVLAATGQERAQDAGRDLIGHPAPVLSLKTIDGETIDLAKYYGQRPVYLKFWATWCVPCREQMPHFERTFETRGEQIAVIAVDTGFNETVEDVRAYRRALGLKMPIVIDDGRFARAFNLRVTPQHVVIGRDGEVLFVGHLVDDALEQALQAAIAQTASSRAPLAGAARGARPAQREPAPEVITTLDGPSFALHDPAASRRTVLMFISPWCESYLAQSRPARSQACRAAREQSERLLPTSDARWLAIASGLWANRDDLIAYRNEEHVTVPLSLDESGALFRRYHVTQVPTFIVLDAQGRLVRRIEAAPPDLAAQLASSSP
jgi:peroxiredoxin